MRNIITVIEKIENIAPDLSGLDSIRTSALYTAPEARNLLWDRLALYLNENADSHPQKENIKAIFNDAEES